MAEYQAKLDAMREQTARLRALRLARHAESANKGATSPSVLSSAASRSSSRCVRRQTGA